MKKTVIFLLGSLIVFSCSEVKQKKELKPNIIYILADDLGYGDLSCYGQQNFQTPHLDNLARQGMKFTQHYSGSTVCAPSRSCLMTGLHTGHTPIRGNKEQEIEGQMSLPASSLTLAELLKNAGYKTGAFGKWGLGFIGHEGDPNKQGFDEFYGYNCQRMAHRYYPPYLWQNETKVFLNGNDWTNTVTYAPDKIQEATLRFIEENKDTTFFAYVPLVLPHAELISPNDSLLQYFQGKFAEKPYLPTEPYTSDYGPDIIPQQYCSQDSPYAVFASMVTRLDAYVGQIITKLEELGIKKNTIIMFASDNGPHEEGGANPDFFNSAGGLRGVKRDLYEGGIRTPMIVVWPDKVKAGSTSNHISAFWDIMPTCAEIAGVQLKSETDGISFLPELLGQTAQKKHEYLYWEFSERGGRQAIRMGDWKAIVYDLQNNPKPKIQLYNLAEDEWENNDISSEHPEIVIKMTQLMKNARTESELFPLFQ